MTMYVATNILTLPIAPNASESLTDTIRAHYAQTWGTRDGIPISYHKHADAIMKAWPGFKAAARARNLEVNPSLWEDFVRATFDRLEKEETTAVAAAKRDVGLNAHGLNASQVALCAKLGVKPESFAAELGERVATNAQTEPSHKRMARLLGLTPAQAKAAYGDR